MKYIKDFLLNWIATAIIMLLALGAISFAVWEVPHAGIFRGVASLSFIGAMIGTIFVGEDEKK